MSGIVGDNTGRGSGTIKSSGVGADEITGAEIADDVIDSEHYVAASIDNEHLADNAVGTDEIADNAVTLAKMAGGTDGNIISYDASGDPVAIATGTDGQVLTSTGAGSPPAFETPAGGGKVLQVVETRKIDTFTTSTSASTVDITGLSVSITPSATSSKILVFAHLNSGATTGDGVYRLYRDSTSLGQGTDGSGSPISGITGLGQHRSQYELATGSFVYLDSPSSTSSLTYKISVFKRGTVAFYINRTTTEGTEPERVSSSITVMEIGA